MAEKELNWKFVEDGTPEDEVTAEARRHALEWGVTPVSPATGAQLAVLAAATGARNILEIGTGAGVSGLWLLRGAPEAQFTSIDAEPEHLDLARRFFGRTPASPRVRLIPGRALDVLPRMNSGAYDLVFIDADAESLLDYVEFGLRLVRRGGTVAVAHALWFGKVADPAVRGEPVHSLRSLLGTLAESSAVVTALSPVGDGLLQITRVTE